MAVNKQCLCIKCMKGFTAICNPTDHPSECPDCKNKENETKERIHFAELDTLTLDERVRRIEKRLYSRNIKIKPFNPTDIY